MRLGDLDALKEEVALMFGDKTHITESVCELIDNAETYNQVGHRMATAEGFITNPEWNKGDLISHEALKNVFEEHEDRRGDLDCDWRILINNAPTVEPRRSQDTCKGCEYLKESNKNGKSN